MPFSKRRLQENYDRVVEGYNPLPEDIDYDGSPLAPGQTPTRPAGPPQGPPIAPGMAPNGPNGPDVGPIGNGPNGPQLTKEQMEALFGLGIRGKHEKEGKEIAEQRDQSPFAQELAEFHRRASQQDWPIPMPSSGGRVPRRNPNTDLIHGNIFKWTPPPQAPPFAGPQQPGGPATPFAPNMGPAGPRPEAPQNYNQGQYMQDLMQAAKDQYNRPYEGYRGLRFAPENQYEQWANRLSQRTQDMNPFLQASQQQMALGQQGFPSQMQNYMNPYQQQVADRIEKEGLRTLNEKMLPALEAKFVRLGRHGGKRHAELSQNAQRDIASEIADRKNQAMHAGYGQAADIFGSDQARRMQAAEQQANLGRLMNASRLADIASLRESGLGHRELAERKYRSNEQEHLNRMNHRAEQFNSFRSIASGLPTRSSLQPTVAPALEPSSRRSYHSKDWQNLAGLVGATWLGQR